MNPLLDHFETTCTQRPDQLAACDQSLTLDYKSLRAVAAGLAQQIRGSTQRARVGILAPTSAAGVAAMFACWYAGRVPVPINFLLSPPEIGRIIADAELDLLLTTSHFEALVRAAGLRALLLGPDTLKPSRMAVPDAQPEDLAVILYTSGTSGDPKGVCLSYRNLAGNAQACIEHARITPEHVWLSPLPQFHSFGCTAMTITPMLLGVTVWYVPRFSPVAVAQLIAEKRVTMLMAIPSMYAALLNLKNVQRSTFASLTYVISGGEPLPARVFQGFQERFGVTLYEGYGMTESSPVVSLNTPWSHRVGSVGTPIPGVSVTAVDEAGQPQPPGTPGELLIRGHCVMQGYHRKPEATAAAVRDGALYSGDRGHVDRDGFVFITGRVKEMIIVGGENVYPREIEDALLEHPAVGEAAAIGFRDDVRGELPAAYVILKEDAVASETELRDFCRARLAGYKVPRWIRIERELPRSSTGKILKRALKPERS